MSPSNIVTFTKSMLWPKQYADSEKKQPKPQYYENINSTKYAKIALGVGLVSGFYSGPGDYVLSKIQNHYEYNSLLLWGKTAKAKTALILKDLIEEAENLFKKDKKASLMKLKQSLEELLKKKFPNETISESINIEKEAAKLQKIIRNKRIANIILYGLAFFLIAYYTCENINKKNG